MTSGRDFGPFLRYITGFTIPVTHIVGGESRTSDEHKVFLYSYGQQTWQLVHTSPSATQGYGFLGNARGFNTYWNRLDNCWIPATEMPQMWAPDSNEQMDWFYEVTLFTSIEEALEVTLREAATIQMLQNDYDSSNPVAAVDDTPSLKFN